MELVVSNVIFTEADNIYSHSIFDKPLFSLVLPPLDFADDGGHILNISVQNKCLLRWSCRGGAIDDVCRLNIIESAVQ